LLHEINVIGAWASGGMHGLIYHTLVLSAIAALVLCRFDVLFGLVAVAGVIGTVIELRRKWRGRRRFRRRVSRPQRRANTS